VSSFQAQSYELLNGESNDACKKCERVFKIMTTDLGVTRNLSLLVSTNVSKPTDCCLFDDITENALCERFA
jgi:hypothetical protein